LGGIVSEENLSIRRASSACGPSLGSLTEIALGAVVGAGELGGALAFCTSLNEWIPRGVLAPPAARGIGLSAELPPVQWLETCPDLKICSASSAELLRRSAAASASGRVEGGAEELMLNARSRAPT
jgi:hypothetical protein